MEQKLNGLNPALNDMIARGQFSASKLEDLIRLRVIVDRFACNDRVEEAEASRLEKIYGVPPDIRTWSDYFQTEIASNYHESTDEEFSRIVDTIQFDLISAIKIFAGKNADFCREVEDRGMAVQQIPGESWTEVDEEDAHLFILHNYYREMALHRREISAEDEEWFQGFLGESRTAVG